MALARGRADSVKRRALGRGDLGAAVQAVADDPDLQSVRSTRRWAGARLRRRGAGKGDQAAQGLGRSRGGLALKGVRCSHSPAVRQGHPAPGGGTQEGAGTAAAPATEGAAPGGAPRAQGRARRPGDWGGEARGGGGGGGPPPYRASRSSHFSTVAG